MYKACPKVLKVHFHSKNKEETTQSHFYEKLRNWAKNRCNLPVRHTKQEARRTEEAQHI